MVKQCYVCKKSRYNYPNLTYHRFPVNQDRRKLWYTALGFDETKVLPRTAEICSNHFESKNFTIKPAGRTYLTSQAVPQPFYPEVLKPKAPVVSQESGHEEPNTYASSIQSTSTGDYDSDSTLYDIPEKSSNVDTEQLPPSTSFKNDICTDTESIRDDKELEQMKCTLDIKEEVVDYRRSTSPLSSSSSSTLTASETEDQIMKLINGQHKETLPPNIVGPESGFKGKLALLSLPKPRRIRYAGDITSDDFSSPIKAKRNLQIIKNTIQKQRSKIRVLHNTVRRLKNRINTLKGLLKASKEK